MTHCQAFFLFIFLSLFLLIEVLLSFFQLSFLYIILFKSALKTLLLFSRLSHFSFLSFIP